ncbi:ATP-dependent Clp protease proteolytic subunit [Azospirillum soli]|uniref:ATP-dependent Clp protease proteolytic subunit n=1 Tax=Azospirillum soli TaxID=1304799 RepID=UPI001AE61CC3|nr:ATP-dependent Clp protease proteolytic subunit [Azospirillum soli]MBP2316783.1 hypothetical protein [Azospirillum soli]
MRHRFPSAWALAVTLSVTACANTITINGLIDDALARQVVERIGESNAPIVRIELESNGGWVQAGFDIVAAIERARPRARIVTRVRDHCHSMCVALFLAGDERIADPGASFILHVATDPAGHALPVATGWLLGYYLTRGVDPQWLAEGVAPEMMTSNATVSLSGRQLAERLDDPR